MEPPNDNQLPPFYHPATTAAASPTNGLLPPGTSADGVHMMYSAAAPSAAVTPAPTEPARRKRGRPRKYGTPELALAAKKAATSSSSRERKEHQGFGANSSPTPSYSGISKKSPSTAAGNVGQGFTPHIISVSAGEDVNQKIMRFVQQSEREICIMSASGSICNASLRQPATSGGIITYEGRFEILTLSGSYVHTELGGRSGALSVSLCDSSGQIIGGGVGGMLTAAGPVQVVVGSFLVQPDQTDNYMGGGEYSGGGMQQPSPSASPSPVGIMFHPPQSSSSAAAGGIYRPTLDPSYMVQSGRML